MAEPFAAALALGGGWREAADTLGSGLAGAKGRLWTYPDLVDG